MISKVSQYFSDMNIKEIVIFGAGRGSRDVLQLIEQINKEAIVWKIVGFVDTDLELGKKIIDNIPVYKIADDIGVSPENLYGVTGIQAPKIRRAVVENEIVKNGLKLATLIHPDIDIPNDAIFGKGCVIFPGVIIAKGVTLGQSVLVNYNTLLGIDLVIGNYSFIGPSVVITASCSIGKESVVGAGCLFVPGVSVGDGCMIGLGTRLIGHVGDSLHVFDFPKKITRENNMKNQKVSW